MTKMADITFRDNQFHLSGELNFSNVMSVYKKSLLASEKCPELVFDFSQIQSSDSSGLALMIEWIKLGKKNDKPVRFINISNDLLSIAKAAGIDGIIVKGVVA